MLVQGKEVGSQCCKAVYWRQLNSDLQATESGLRVRVPGCQKLQRRLNTVWHRMLYSCTHMATVSVRGLMF